MNKKKSRKLKKKELIEENNILTKKENESKISRIEDNSIENKKNKTIEKGFIDLIFGLKNAKKEKSALSQTINQNKQIQRNYGIDIARIVSMYFIINLHILYHGGPLFKSKLLSSENNLYVFFCSLFNSGVNIFGMISGFVGFRTHKFANLMHLLIQTSLYNYGIAYYFYKTRPQYVNNLNYFLYPLFIVDYWYFNAYFIMYFFLPLINSGINSMDKRKYGIFNLFIFLFFSCFYQIRHYLIKT